jgi:hypothetical protein
LIPNAYVFHKRRGDFSSFFNQIFSFGKTRVQLKTMFNIPIKIVHLFPVGFVFFTLLALALSFTKIHLNLLPSGLLLAYFGIIFVHSTMNSKNIKVGFLTVPAVFIQHLAYGLGFLKEYFFPMSK